MKIKDRAMRLTATLLSFALIQVSFGPEAWAQLVPQVGAITAPVGGASAAAGSLSIGGGNPAAIAMPSGASLTASPLAAPSAFLSAPSAAPSLPISAISDAAPASGAAASPAAAAAHAAASAVVSQGHAAPALEGARLPAAAAPIGPDGKAEAPRGAWGPAGSLAPGAASEPSALESAPRTASIGARVSQRFAELKSFFGGRRDAGALPAGTSAAANASAPHASGLAPATGPISSDAAATKKMMGRYVLASNSSQAGYEMLSSASLPIYLDQTFHKISMMADLSIVGTFASVIGRQISPLIVNSMPLKKSYIGMLGAAFVVAMAIGVLANLHVLTVLPLFGLMILFRLTQAGAATAERTVIPSVLGKDQVAMEHLRGTKQSWAEVASVLVQNGAAVLVVVLGTATKNLLIAPFFYVAAIGILWFSLKIPKAADDARVAAYREKAAQNGVGIVSVFKNFGKQVAKGYQVVMHDPALRASAMITMLMILFNVMTYSILAPAFGKFAIAAMGAGAASTSAAPIMGLIAGLFSFGGLFAGKIVTKHAQNVEAKHGGDAPAAEEAARSSAMRWLKYGALSFLAVGAMALPLPIIGPLINLGSHAAIAVTAVLGTGTILSMWKPKLGLALAMAPVLLAFPSHVALAAVAFFGFGLLQVVASLKNDSLFDKLVQEKAPADYANAAAFVGAFSMFAGMLGLAALKFLIYGSLPFGIPSPFAAFAGLPGIWPFVAIFGGLAVPAMLAMLYFTRRLDRLTTPDGAKKN